MLNAILYISKSLLNSEILKLNKGIPTTATLSLNNCPQISDNLTLSEEASDTKRRAKFNVSTYNTLNGTRDKL